MLGGLASVRRQSCLASFLVGALTIQACSEPEREPASNAHAVAPPRQAILIVLDAARSDRFSSYGYPRATTPEMDALAKGGAHFPQHYTQGRSTRFALPILLYSRYYTRNLLPYVQQVALADPEELFRDRRIDTISLPKAFEAAGFHTAMVSAHTWLRVDTEFAREFIEPHDLPTEMEYDPRYGYPRAGEVIDYTIEWLQVHADEDFFLYVHLMDPHFPHLFDKDAREFFGADDYDAPRIDPRGRVIDPSELLSETDQRYLDALYDGSLRYTDRHIGRLAAFLRERARLDDTLIAVTADHGDKLLEHPNAWEHGGTMFEELARIPFLIHYPQARELAGMSGFSELVDVAPTILGLMGVELPAGKTMDGVDLREVARGERAAKRQAFARRMVRTERYKADFAKSDKLLLGTVPPRYETIQASIFDLVKDPKEQIDLGEDFALRDRLFDLYRQRMLPYYEKYISAPETGQPDGPFAIGANHLELDIDPPTSRVRPPIAELLAIDSDTGWSRMSGKGARGSWIFAKEEAEPIALRAGVPDGLYVVAIGLTGSARFEVPTVEGVQVVHAASEWFGEKPYRKAETINLGLVQVTNQKLELRVAPEPGRPWLLIHHIGFWPSKQGDGAPSDTTPDEEMLERLRTLGYID